MRYVFQSFLLPLRKSHIFIKKEIAVTCPDGKPDLWSTKPPELNKEQFVAPFGRLNIGAYHPVVTSLIKS